MLCFNLVITAEVYMINTYTSTYKNLQKTAAFGS